GDREPPLIGIARDRLTGHILDDDVWAAFRGHARVENACDVWMIEQRKLLPLDIEPRHHVAARKAGAQQLDRDAAPHGLELLREVDFAHSALTERLEPNAR